MARGSASGRDWNAFHGMTIMKKLPSAVDRHIGARVRARRIEVGLSQEKLGGALGITFQQIQKYEKGTNRMGASRLQLAATMLGVPVGYFYEGAPGVPGTADGIFLGSSASVALTPDEVALLECFRRVTDTKVRRRVQQLVAAMADG
jgi:transcriptional regulator with XRE-family HTH domain